MTRTTFYGHRGAQRMTLPLVPSPKVEVHREAALPISARFASFGPTRTRFRSRATTNPTAFVQALCDARRARSPGLMVLGAPVCKPSAVSDPVEDIFHFLHGGHPLVFVEGCQGDRVAGIVSQAANDLKKIAPTRLFDWNSAEGWCERHPENGQRFTRTADDQPPLPFDRAHAGAIIPFNDAGLIQELYGVDPRAQRLDPLNPIEALRAAGAFAMKEQTTDAPPRAIFLFHGMGPHLTNSLRGDGRILQQLKNVAGNLGNRAQEVGLGVGDSLTQIVFNDSGGMTPDVARELGTRYELPLPDRSMLESLLFRSIANYCMGQPTQMSAADVPEVVVANWREYVGQNVSDRLIRAAVADGVTLEAVERLLPINKSFAQVSEQLVGFSLAQAIDVVGRSLSRTVHTDGRIDFDELAAHRLEMLKRDFCITMVKLDPNLPRPVGLDAAVADLELVKTIFECGDLLDPPLPTPKMMLYSGVSGTGKSLICKHGASYMNLPLYKLDLATLFSKWVGDSERNFANLFKVLEALAPCAIWIDEIEKAIGAREGDPRTHEVTQRAHGQFLHWVEEHRSKVLIFSTCNDPRVLSSAVLDRADRRWFVGYQDPASLAANWAENANKISRHQMLSDADFAELAAAKPTIVGREIHQRLTHAMGYALAEARAAKRNVVSDPPKLERRHVERALAGYLTHFETDPDTQLEILALSADYVSASGKPLIRPPPPQTAQKKAEPPRPARSRRDDAI